MYCGHFGFSEKPFDMTPDPKYLYLNHNNKEVFAALKYGIRDRRGFISIIGEVGTGKTTLLNAALDQLDENTKAAYIFNTSVTFDKILATTLFELGLKKSDESLSKIHAIDRLNNFAIEQLTAGGNVALIIDEAQNLDMKSLENLRLLSNLETRKHKLIQIVIAGQPELDAILQRQELRQLSQRINLNRYVIPLSEKETNDYIRHRLTVADYKGPHLFDRRAQKLIWEYSNGIPRKINILCDNALLTGYGVKKKRITTSLMEEAVKDLTRTPFVPSGAPPDQIATHRIDRRRRKTTRPLPRRLSLAAGLGLMAVIIFGLGLILGHPDLGWRENITRLSQHVFQSQKTSQGGGAGGTPTTKLPSDDVQVSMNQAVDDARVPREKVEDEPVPAEKAQDEPVATVPLKAANVSSEKVEDKSAPAEMVRDEPAQAVEVATTSVPSEKVEDEPVPTLEVSTSPVQAEEIEAAPVLAEDLEASRASTEGVVAAAVPSEKVGPASPAAAPPAYFLPESISATEETKKQGVPFAQKETTEESDALPALELSRQRLPLALSIRPGDTLSAIIIQHYGSYNQETLHAVLHENPEIQNPDRIFVGEILKLPISFEKP